MTWILINRHKQANCPGFYLIWSLVQQHDQQHSDEPDPTQNEKHYCQRPKAWVVLWRQIRHAWPALVIRKLLALAIILLQLFSNKVHFTIPCPICTFSSLLHARLLDLFLVPSP